MIRQFHLEECHSTQDVLKEQLARHESLESILVSCENQTSGRGRGENKWEMIPGGLCFSFNLTPHKMVSFTALELSVLIARYFESRGVKLFLKWPNDLWDKDLKKCGGILVQGAQNQYLAGVGLNLYSNQSKFGSVLSQEPTENKAGLALDLTEFIHQNRYSDSNVLSADWIQRCGHLNHMVSLTEGDLRSEGIFQGLGEFGEAIICVDAKPRRFFNGSLRLT